jgi:hypothetical protein
VGLHAGVPLEGLHAKVHLLPLFQRLQKTRLPTDDAAYRRTKVQRALPSRSKGQGQEVPSKPGSLGFLGQERKVRHGIPKFHSSRHFTTSGRRDWALLADVTDHRLKILSSLLNPEN